LKRGIDFSLIDEYGNSRLFAQLVREAEGSGMDINDA